MTNDTSTCMTAIQFSLFNDVGLLDICAAYQYIGYDILRHANDYNDYSATE